jgi:copper chaperone CopZ
VKNVKANFINELVIVEYDDTKTGVPEFEEALARKGYRVESVRFLD